MDYPERFSNLPDYAFPRLRKLLDGRAPGGEPIVMTIGEPQHAFPDFVPDILAQNVGLFAKYPTNEGSSDLLATISGWISRRYGVDYAADELMVLNGTREGLFNAALAISPEEKHGGTPNVLIPNPFYQVYAVAAVEVRANPVFVNADPAQNFMPNFAALSQEALASTTIAYVCSPANPQGSVSTLDQWKACVELAEIHDFVIFADECYSEIYRDAPPPGALEAVAALGADRNRVVSFQSLSKRSNLPGLRSGFAASGRENIARLRQLRSYAGAPLPMPLQAVAAAAWADEAHVVENRALYAEKYTLADEIFADVAGYAPPQAGFFLWLPVENDEAATIRLWEREGVKVLPGSYLSREVDGVSPGQQFIRVAMVAPTENVRQGLMRIRSCLYEQG